MGWKKNEINNARWNLLSFFSKKKHGLIELELMYHIYAKKKYLSFSCRKQEIRTLKSQ